MSNQPFERMGEAGVLGRIREGMTVRDRDGNNIGTVELVHFGASADGAQAARPGGLSGRSDSAYDLVAEVFAPQDNLAEPVRARLQQEGFIRLDAAGFLAADRYITPDQIHLVTGDEVVLRVTRDSLIRE